MKKRKNKKRISYIRVLFLICIVLLPIVIIISIFQRPDVSQTDEEVIVSHQDLDLSRFHMKNGLMIYDHPDYICKQGVDVSSFQHDIDWWQVRQDGIDFAMIRCGFRGAEGGLLWEDELYRTNIENAIAAGLDVGIYFFSSALSFEEVQEEVDYVYDLVKDYDITFPIAYDMEFYENGRIYALNNDEKTAFAKYFCDAFNSMGYKTLIYGNKDWLQFNLNTDELLDYDLWYAAYISEPKLDYTFVMWQYSNNGSVLGIDTNVDMNVYLEKRE